MAANRRTPIVMALCAAALLSCGGAQPAAAPAPRPRRGGPTPTAAAPDPFPGGEVPRDVAVLVDAARQPCVPRMRVALDQHQMQVEGRDGQPSIAYLLGPGARLCLVGERRNGVLSNLRLVDDRTVLARSQQDTISLEVAAVGIGTVLVVRNPYDAPLRYRAVMHVAGKKNASPTSICPVRERLVGLEHWPDAVDLLMVGDFRLQQPNEPLDCR